MNLAYNLIHRFNVGDALRRTAVRSPQQRALHFQGRDLTYAELDALANRVARLLLANGIGRGDSVAIFSMNSPEYVATFFGCARIGAALAPINLMFTADDVDYVFEKTRTKALLVEPMFFDKTQRRPAVYFLMDDVFRETLASHDGSPVEQFVSSEETSLIVFTSGTTARPKGVVLNHLNLYAYLLATFTEHGVDRTNLFLLSLLMFTIPFMSQSF